MTTAGVTIHSSQFPENVRRDLLASLRERRINPKFHYDSLKQTLKWLALHEAHSPARTDRNVLGIYDHAFAATAKAISSKRLHVIGLGCGGGQKDARLLELLKQAGKTISYTPSDVSVAMTLVARAAALKVLPAENCFPLVCDLATAEDLPTVLANRRPALFTFFGMIPNFEPGNILPKLAALVQKKDYLLFSVNLAPGSDYAAGVKAILPQYDNALTREWLMTLLLDLGIERTDGRLVFGVEDGAVKLKRVVAGFHFLRAREIMVHGETFNFQRGETIRLFFSYRYTPDRVVRLLARHGLKVQAEWLADSGEEGVFLCQHA
jgi:L-histidine N-alpha-methyltransferase